MFRPLIGSRIAEAVSTDNKALKSTAETPSSANMHLEHVGANSIIIRPLAEVVSTDNKAFKSTAETPSSANTHLEHIGAHNIIIGSGEVLELNFPTNPSNEELDRIYRKIYDYQSGLIPVLLQPGNGLVKQLVLRARKSLFFIPIEYTFQIQIKYAVDNMEQLEVIPFKLNIRSAIRSTIIGAIIGGVIGTVAQIVSKHQPIALGPIALAAIFSAVAVVAFARKTNLTLSH